MADFTTLKTQIRSLVDDPLTAQDVKGLIKIDKEAFEKNKQALKAQKKKGRTASGTNKNGGEGGEPDGIASPLTENTSQVQGGLVATEREYWPERLIELPETGVTLKILHPKKIVMKDDNGEEAVFYYAEPASDA